MQYFGSMADAKAALLSSGLPESGGVLSMSDFTFSYGTFLDAFLAGIGGSGFRV